jgi:hypothetical protein
MDPRNVPLASWPLACRDFLVLFWCGTAATPLALTLHSSVLELRLSFLAAAVTRTSKRRRFP